jgi:hypothetical protein
VRRAPLVAAAAGAVLILVALAALLVDSNHRVTSSADSPFGIPVHVDPGARVCQPRERLPAGTGFVLYHPVSKGALAGPLRVVLQDRTGRVLSTSLTPAGRYGPGPGYARVGPVKSDLSDARLCIVNAGKVRVDIKGGLSATPRAELPKQRQYSQRIQLRLDYYTAAKKSWLSLSPQVADRYGLVKATFFGAWTFWLAMAALLAVCLGSVLYAGRELSR